MFKVGKLPKVWAIIPEDLVEIETRLRNIKTEDVECVERKAKQGASALQETTAFMVGNVGVLPINGVIQPKADFFSFFFGGASIDILTRDFNALLNDEDVDSIILDIDSPGGNAFMIQEFANVVFEGREVKPIFAITSTSMTSAAYWIGAGAHEVYITDEVAITGSIGVVTSHVDVSELEKSLGIKVTEVVAGTHKRVTSSHHPLTAEGRIELQNQVDHIYTAFVDDIARFRGVEKTNVINNMAEGRIFLGSQGVEAGLVDAVLPSVEVLQLAKEATLVISNDNIFKGGNGMSNLAKKATKEVLTIEALKANHSEVFEAVFALGAESTSETLNKTSFDAGHKEGIEKGKELGIAEGAKAECQRIADVRANAMKGHEALTEQFVADGKTTGAEAAVAILAAENAKKTAGLETLEKEAVKPLGDNVSADESGTGTEPQTLQEKWDSDASIRDEFSSFGSYEAYTKAVESGQVRIFKHGRGK